MILVTRLDLYAAPMSIDGYLTSAQAAQRAGVKTSTWSSYVSRGQAPEPHTYIDRRTPLWTPEQLDQWAAGRRGQGWRRREERA